MTIKISLQPFTGRNLKYFLRSILSACFCNSFFFSVDEGLFDCHLSAFITKVILIFVYLKISVMPLEASSGTWLDSFTFNFILKKGFWGWAIFSMEFSHCWVKEPYPKSYKPSWTWKMLHCKKEPYLSSGQWGSKLHKDRQTSCNFYIIIIIKKYWIFQGEWCLL